jgi:uncharacterized repeat protein (TIGR01451 family)
MRHIFKTPLLSFAAIGLILAGGRYARADANATDFENFALGDINGQNGWASGHGSSFCPVYDVAAVANTYGYPSFGTQSLRISNAITCGSFNDQTFSPSLANEAGETAAGTSTYSGGTRQPYFEAQWDFASTVPGSEQPDLSVVASADRGDTMRMSWLQMQDTPAGLQVNFEDYQHSLLNFVTTPIATGLDRTVPHTIKMTIQFIDGPGNDVVNIYLDGTLIHTGTTWEDYYRDFVSGIPFPVDSVMFRVAGTAVPATMGKGFLIDNFSSFSGPVPSPASPAPEGAAKGAATITVVNTVVNAKGGTKTAADFPLFVNGAPVVSGATNIFPAPADVYHVTETADPNYVRGFSGDCDATGSIGLSPGNAAVCIITNTYAGPATVIVTPVPPLLDVMKTASPTALPNGPGEVTYSYIIKNIGSVPITDVTMTGDTCSPIKLISGDLNNDNILDVNEAWTYHCSMTLAASQTNTVITTGRANGLTTSDIASATVVVGTPSTPPSTLPPAPPSARPVIHATMVPSPMTLPDDGGSVIYKEVVTNPGNVPLSGVNITDNICSALKYVSGDANNDSKLDPAETWTYTCQVNLGKTSTSTSIAYGTGDGSTVRDIALATVVVAAPASITSASVKSIKADLSLGSRGNNVKILQKFLMSDIDEVDDIAPRALSKAGATGYFGPLTRAALVEFQDDVGIKPAVGYFGPLTRAYLNAHY